MALVTTEQEYIDNVLFEVQCCIGTTGDSIATAEGLGNDCEQKKNDLILLYAIQSALVRYDITVEDEDSCLTKAQINDLINKVKGLCNSCCIENLEIVEE